MLIRHGAFLISLLIGSSTAVAQAPVGAREWVPISREVIAAVESARGKVIKWPTMGGSVPMGAMERAAETHTITVPIANHDNSQHSANENIRLQNLWDGIETMAALLTMK